MVDGTELGDGEVEFNYHAESEVSGEIQIDIEADEEMSRTWMQCDGEGNLQEETITYDGGDTVAEFSTGILGGQTLDTEFQEILNIAGDYRWNGEINSDEDETELASAGPDHFTTTSQAPEDTEEDCAGDE